MLNATVRAAATGLSSALFDRRRMLLGLAAASTAAAAPVALASAPVESAELLQLADETPARLDEFNELTRERWRIVREWTPRLPEVPEPIRNPRWRGEGAMDANLVGAARQRDFNILPPLFWQRSIEHYRGNIAALPANKRMKEKTRNRIARVQQQELAKSEANLQLSEAFFAEFERVKLASGYKAADDRMDEARKALAAHISRVMAIQPETMAGVLIQARAMEAASSIAPVWQLIDSKGSRWGESLAASILRIASAAA